MIAAGKLNKQITFEELTQSRGDMGGVSNKYDTYTTVWASVKEMAGSESNESDTITGSNRAEIIVRNDTNNPINTKMRINYGGYFWDILSIQEYGFNEGWQIVARKREDLTV